jgi:hypothetical protein
MGKHKCFAGLQRLFKKRQEAQVEAECQRLLAAAEQAETTHDYLRAAGFLDQLQKARPDTEQLRRLAYCRLRAGQWPEAAAAYVEAGCSLPADCYHAGFAAAKAGCFAESLRYWQQIQSMHPDFLAQKERVSQLLTQELHCRLDEQPLAQEEEVRQLIQECALDTYPEGKALLARCDRLRLARLWQEDQLEELLSLAGHNTFCHATILEIQAKATCQFLINDRTAVSAPLLQQFIDSWLSALFHPQIARQAGEQRQALLDFGEHLLRRHATRLHKGQQLMQEWEQQLALLNKLTKLPAVQEQELSVCTPALALQTGQNEQLCRLIRESRDDFATNEEWIEAGAAYAVANALLLVRNAMYETALKELIHLEEQRDDPFLAYGAAQVRTACGLEALRQGRCREAEEILVGGEPQATWSTELKQQLLMVLAQENGQETPCLAACLNILRILPTSASRDETAKAFCTALTKLVVRLHNGKKARPQLLAAAMQKAVALHPEDEFARMMLEEVSIALELAELHEAIDQGWLSKAARIAAASRYEQVVTAFFVAAEQVAVQLEQGEYPDTEAAILILEDLLRSVSRVDAKHKMIHEIERSLTDLRLKQEMA